MCAEEDGQSATAPSLPINSRGTSELSSVMVAHWARGDSGSHSLTLGPAPFPRPVNVSARKPQLARRVGRPEQRDVDPRLPRALSTKRKKKKILRVANPSWLCGHSYMPPSRLADPGAERKAAAAPASPGAGAAQPGLCAAPWA